MQVDDQFYRAFLEEMNALEKFRMFYSGVHSSELLGRDDPDVKRMVEALAFFNARTRISSLRNIRATQRRLFEQYFSFLLAPMPAVAILQCEISGRFIEPAFVPKDSEVLVSPGDGSPAVFRTMRDMRVLPISLRKVEVLLRPYEGFRILLHFRTPYGRRDEIGKLPVYIDYLNNYHASLQLLHAIRKHLKKCSVFFDETAGENSQGSPCPVEFGSSNSPEDTANVDLSHPLQKIRSFFHFPQQELYMTFRMPAPPRDWKDFTICLDMDQDWPKNLTLNKDVFQLFTVPIVNLKHSMAQTIFCRGLKERYLLKYGDVGGKFDLHSVLGVFRLAEKGPVPVRPGILSRSSGSYEIEHSRTESGETQTWLLLDFPESFEKPEGIAVDSLWMQAWFSEKVSQEMDASLFGRHVDGVTWMILGEIHGHRENPLAEDGEAMLQMLSLQRKPVYSLDEIHCLLDALGTIEKSAFQAIPRLLESAEVKVVPQSRQIGGVRHIYLFRLKEFDATYRPLVEIFLVQLTRLLHACSADSAVTLKASISGTGETIQFE